MMDHAQARSAALALPGVVEMAPVGRADLRVGGRIFATLPGGWGRQGWTRLGLAGCGAATLRSALSAAWRNASPARTRR